MLFLINLKSKIKMKKMKYHRTGLFFLLIPTFCFCIIFGCKKETENKQDEPFLFKGKNKNTSQLPQSIYLGKDSIGSYEFLYKVDTMNTRQWAYVKEKGGMLSILEDSINLDTDEGLDRLENLLGYQEVDFNPEMLFSQDSFKAELFGDILEFNIQNVEKFEFNDELWTGIINKENSSFTIYKSDSIYSASFYFDETKYELKKENESYIIKRINQETFFDEDEPLYEINFDDDELDDEGFLKDSNEYIDVLVCYSQTAKISSGGLSNINSEIGLAVAETNLSYKNSKVKHRLRLAGTMELKYQETRSSKNDVIWIKQNKKVADERNKVKADLVIFIVENLNGSCGRAYAIQKRVTLKFAPYAYCVVKRSCSTGYYSFGHEVAHLMGGRHDCKNDSKPTPFDFNHGYEYCKSQNRWRTVMSYDNCGSKRIPYWSNPNVNYKSIPMGNIDTSRSCKSDNSELLNRTSLTVANFRTQASIK